MFFFLETSLKLYYDQPALNRQLTIITATQLNRYCRSFLTLKILFWNWKKTRPENAIFHWLWWIFELIQISFARIILKFKKIQLLDFGGIRKCFSVSNYLLDLDEWACNLKVYEKQSSGTVFLFCVHLREKQFGKLKHCNYFRNQPFD